MGMRVLYLINLPKTLTTFTCFLFIRQRLLYFDMPLGMITLHIDKMFSEMFQSTQPDYASLRREFLISSTLWTTGVRLGSFQLSNSRLHRWI